MKCDWTTIEAIFPRSENLVIEPSMHRSTIDTFVETLRNSWESEDACTRKNIPIEDPLWRIPNCLFRI
jgi:hypothetical protein